MQTKISIFILILFISSHTQSQSIYEPSQNKDQAKKSSWISYQGFTGGMFTHVGFIKSKTFLFPDVPSKQVKGLSFGIGGRIGFHFGKHLRIGGEGSSSTSRYPSSLPRAPLHPSAENTSSSAKAKDLNLYRLSSGGLTLEYLSKEMKGFKVFTGAMLGGGSINHILLIEQSEEGNKSLFREQTFMLISPILGLEYRFNKKMSVVLKSDYLFSLSKNTPADFSTGPRLYFGLIFNTLYKK